MATERGTKLSLVEPTLLNVEHARILLAKATSFGEVKSIHDKAHAIVVYLRHRKAALESINDATEILIRSERRLGEFTRSVITSKGGRPPKTPSSVEGVSKEATLARAGLDPKAYSQRSRWELLARLAESDFEAHLRDVRAKCERLTTSGALKLAKEKRSREEKFARIASEPVAPPTGRYRVIVIDPPWKYRRHANNPTHRARNPYPDLSPDEIRALPLQAVAATDCILWLWTTNACMKDALDSIEFWGFEEKTILTWVKDRIGTGHWLRGQTEHCVLATRGKPIVKLTSQSTALHAPMREHSRKPDEFYALVEALCPGSKLEMFARQKRAGWTSWGAETEFFGEAS